MYTKIKYIALSHGLMLLDLPSSIGFGVMQAPVHRFRHSSNFFFFFKARLVEAQSLLPQ